MQQQQLTCEAVSISTRSVMGSLSGEDASAGMTTTGLMCSDSAEARRKLGGFWGRRGVWLGWGEPALPQGFGHSWLKSCPSAELPMPGPMGTEPGPMGTDPGKGSGLAREGIPAPGQRGSSIPQDPTQGGMQG